MTIVRIAIVALSAVALPVQAAEFREFDRAAFEAAQSQGKPILLDVHAWWCPVCASHARTIKAVATPQAYPDLTVFRIDYDKRKGVWRSLDVRNRQP